VSLLAGMGVAYGDLCQDAAHRAKHIIYCFARFSIQKRQHIAREHNCVPRDHASVPKYAALPRKPLLGAVMVTRLPRKRPLTPAKMTSRMR